MPVFASGDQPLPWFEMTGFRIETLPSGSRHRFAREADREKLKCWRTRIETASFSQKKMA